MPLPTLSQEIEYMKCLKKYTKERREKKPQIKLTLQFGQKRRYKTISKGGNALKKDVNFQ